MDSIQPLRSYLKGPRRALQKSEHCRERTIRNSQIPRGIYPRRSAADPAARRGSVGVDRFVCDWRPRPRARDERLRQPDRRLPVRDKIGGRLHDLRPGLVANAARRSSRINVPWRHAGSAKARSSLRLHRVFRTSACWLRPARPGAVVTGTLNAPATITGFNTGIVVDAPSVTLENLVAQANSVGIEIQGGSAYGSALAVHNSSRTGILIKWSCAGSLPDRRQRGQHARLCGYRAERGARRVPEQPDGDRERDLWRVAAGLFAQRDRQLQRLAQHHCRYLPGMLSQRGPAGQALRRPCRRCRRATATFLLRWATPAAPTGRASPTRPTAWWSPPAMSATASWV